MIIVGERINSTRASVQPAMEARDEAFLVQEAMGQWSAGCQYLDVNTATLLDEEPECMAWAVRIIQRAIPGALISIDSPNAKALQAGLEAHHGRAMLNSITGETARIAEVLPLVREFAPRVIVLTMDDEGLHREPEKRFAIGASLVERLAREGVAPGDVFVDPLVFPVSAEDDAGMIALDIMDRLKSTFPGVHTICGVSNVSYGLPMRKLINQVYLMLAMSRGLDAAIIDPLDPRTRAQIVAARTLLGLDPGCRGYVTAYREGRLALDTVPAAGARA